MGMNHIEGENNFNLNQDYKTAVNVENNILEAHKHCFKSSSH